MNDGMAHPATEVPPTASSHLIWRGLFHEAFGSTAVAPGDVTYIAYDVRKEAEEPVVCGEEKVTVPVRLPPTTRSLLYQGAVLVAVQPAPQEGRNLASRAVTS